jgi:membrane protein YdbS with pleckstrin-like domain
MAIPAKLLGEGERVVISVRTHWKTLLGPLVIAVLIVIAATLAVSMLPAGDIGRWLRLVVIGIAVVAALALTVWPVLNWLTASYTVTNRRLITRQGVFTRTGRDIPLVRINDVSYEHGPIDRLLGCGTLVVESAGERGQVVLPDVPHVEQVQLRMTELLFGWSADASRRSPSPGDESGDDTGGRTPAR